MKGQTQAGLDAGGWTDVLPAHASGSTYRITLPLSSGVFAFARLAFEAPVEDIGVGF